MKNAVWAAAGLLASVFVWRLIDQGSPYGGERTHLVSATTRIATSRNSGTLGHSASRAISQAVAQADSTALVSQLAALRFGTLLETVAVGDVTGDGRDDIVATTGYTPNARPSSDDFTLWVIVQQADGTLAAPLRHPIPGQTIYDTASRSLALVDLDLDGVREVMLGHGSSAGYGISVFEGAASGQLVQRGLTVVAEDVTVMVALDLDRDEYKDLATFDGTKIRTYLGDGRGGLELLTTIDSVVAGPGPIADMAAGDYNGDGLTDIALYNGYDIVSVYKLIETGSFALWHSSLPAYPHQRFSALTAIDIHQDDDDDLLIMTAGLPRSTATAKFAMYHHQNNAMVPAPRWGAHYHASAVMGVDMDGDGRQDLLSVRTPLDRTATLSYMRQRGDGSLEPELEFPLTGVHSGGPRSLAAGDFTGDGCKDAAVASEYSLVLFAGNCPRPRIMSSPLPPRLVVPQPTSSSPANIVRPFEVIDARGSPQPLRRAAARRD
ncbi:VCBS repeat-containing protein [Pseudoxanthomonas sp. Root630]|uniref:FG-GAP repeat domain-containing protein n=1 Tax=Pseudoxanthomonas sp. Root630 TaxID=1736574 RepID=UPI0007032C3E|nr:VCBS repeat-containing protein [Pseudoxanthomonas sp. Root630]KRA50543.1 hypothetical protein ASD72_17750 [Pseudoxanthomonas sp. Root630]